ncbi:MAG: BTAD domain-containing putative transcriptional regulator [Chloroflexota bacterium]
MPHLSLTLLGPFQAHLDNKPLLGFQSDKARALLVYLIVERDRPHSRIQLAELFWPDSSEKRARTYLRHALANLRDIMGDKEAKIPFLIVTHHTLQFNQQSQYQLDVADLLEVLEEVRTPGVDIQHPRDLALLQKVVDEYAHPFLDGFYLNHCVAFEEWSRLNRKRIQNHLVDALNYLVDINERLGHHEKALKAAQQIVAIEPWREEAHRRIMQILVCTGQRGAALAQYEVCRHLLREELDVEPGTDTEVLYQKILSGQFDEVFSSTPDDNRLSIRPIGPLIPPNNLPSDLTPLVARDQEIQSILRLLHQEQARLITLTGPGGVGKTRLSIAIAKAMFTTFTDGIYLVELAALRDPKFVTSALAETLSLKNTQRSLSLLDQIIAKLKVQNALLLFDNFEHVLKAASLISTLLASCPQLKVLVTSRELLRLRGEFEFVVQPLLVSEVEVDNGNEIVEEGELTGAVELFRQRACAANHNFEMDKTILPIVTQICRRLDGLPLAIELAAAQSKYYSISDLLARLTDTTNHDSLGFLKMEWQSAPTRQHSLWATITWSYELLKPHEQLLFNRLSIFAGGWTLEAALAVCGKEFAPGVSTLEGMISLVDKSLVCRIHGRYDSARFMMLETIREFGLARLQQSDEQLAIEEKHVTYYKEFTQQAQPKLRSKDSVKMIAAMRVEYFNIRAALRWTLDHYEVETVLALCDALLPFWNITYRRDAEIYLDEAIALASNMAPCSSYVNTLASAGYVAFGFGKRRQGKELLERCLAMNKAIGNLGSPTKLGFTYGLLAWNMFDEGDYDAAYAYWEEALGHAHKAGDEWNLAMQLLQKGYMDYRLGYIEQAEMLIEEAVARHRVVGQKWGISLSLKHFAEVHIRKGNFTLAKQILKESQSYAEELKVQSLVASTKQSLASIALEEANYSKATILLTESIRYQYENGKEQDLLEAMRLFVQLANVKECYTDLLQLASAIAHNYQRLSIILPPLEQKKQDDYIATAYQNLSTESATRAWRLGASMTIDEAVTYVLETMSAKRHLVGN